MESSTIKDMIIKKTTAAILFLSTTVIAGVLTLQFQSQAIAADLDLSNIANVKEKKQLFFSFMRPIVENENEKILASRSAILTAIEIGDDGLLKHFKSQYKLSENASTSDLLKRVDIVPYELALAQSANESSWGQSRFAQQGNNLFGQWCFRKGCGIVPKQRPAGKTYEVSSFDSIDESVRAYIYNLNTSNAYKELRELRFKSRQSGDQPNGLFLAQGLSRYSSRGQDYVDEIQQMIRVNKTLMKN